MPTQQVPIGLEGEHKGVVDLVQNKAYIFEGERGEKACTRVCNFHLSIVCIISLFIFDYRTKRAAPVCSFITSTPTAPGKKQTKKTTGGGSPHPPNPTSHPQLIYPPTPSTTLTPIHPTPTQNKTHTQVAEAPVPDGLQDLVGEKRAEMIERLAEVDDEIAELFLGEEASRVMFMYVHNICIYVYIYIVEKRAER